MSWWTIALAAWPIASGVTALTVGAVMEEGGTGASLAPAGYPGRYELDGRTRRLTEGRTLA